VDWEIFNQPAKGSRKGFSHLAIKADAGGKTLDARVLHGDVPPPFSGTGAAHFAGSGFGVGSETLSRLPHFRRAEFRGSFPFAEIRFQEPEFPGQVTPTAFNPFIPHNDQDSSLPAAFFTITVRNTRRQAIDYVAFTIRNPAQGKKTNRLREVEGAHLLHLTGDVAPTIWYGGTLYAISGPEFGTMNPSSDAELNFTLGVTEGFAPMGFKHLTYIHCHQAGGAQGTSIALSIQEFRPHSAGRKDLSERLHVQGRWVQGRRLRMGQADSRRGYQELPEDPLRTARSSRRRNGDTRKDDPGVCSANLTEVL